MFDVDSLRGVAEAVQKQDGARMLEIVEELERNGKSLQHFCRELSRYWRNLLVVKIARKPSGLIAASEREQQALLETANLFSEEDLTRYLNLMLELYKEMQTSLQPRLHLEIGLIKLVQVGRLTSIEDAIASLPPAQAVRSPSPSPAKPLEKPSAPPQASDLRQGLHDALCKAGMEHSADAVQHSEVRLDGSELVIRAPKSMALLLKDGAVQRVAAQATGKAVRVRVEAADDVNAGTNPILEKPLSTETDVRQRALSHPGVKRFQELFPEAQVRTVRNLNE